MLLKIVYYGNPLLRRKCKPIAQITDEIRKLAADMIETMIAHNGVGLAAPQVGRDVRIFVMREEIMKEEGDFEFSSPEVVINPTLSQPSLETQTGPEGCLSIPGLHLEIQRPQSITIRYQNLLGESKEEKLENFRARVFMHENDHLNGTLTIDRVSSDMRKKIDPILRKIKDKMSPNS